MKALFVISVVLCACSAQYIPPNPCPELFKYSRQGGTIYGEVQFENDQSGDYTLSVNMSVAVLLDNDQNIELELKTSTNEILRGDPLAYNIYFPIQSVIPRPTEIKFNRKIYCRGPAEELTTSGVTNMWASTHNYFSGPIGRPTRRPTRPPQHENSTSFTFFYPPRRPESPQFTTSRTPSFTFPRLPPEWSYNNFPPWMEDRWPPRPSTGPPPPSTSPTTPSTRPTTPSTRPPPPSTSPTTPSTTPTTPPTTRTTPSTRPTTPSTTATTSTTESPEDDDECGRSFIQHLIVGGDIVEEGQFPWMVAIMYSRQSAYTYGCSGSLVSKKHVVTAGHCVLNSRGPLVPFSDILLVLGKVRIDNWARGAVTRGVLNVVPHSDYKHNRGDADIAVIIMDQPVRYEETIRPICLWEGSEDLNLIVGKEGTVAGWGKDESGRDFVTHARKINMPVVSQESCINSNKGLKRLTSDRTFCVGRRDGTGPCTGDSGAGFAMLESGRWVLRGVVSSSLENGSGCNLDDYFIFADAAKFVGWLQTAIAS